MTQDARVDVRDTDIAVVGLACRFPGAPTAAGYWELLRDGRDGTRRLEDDELLARGVARHVFSRPDYVRVSAAIPDIEWFDAPFFGCSPAEAETMDPQHRVFLELAWAALEDAAIDPSRFDGPIACFAGKTLNAYIARAMRADDAASSFLSLVGNDKDFLATQVSYKLDLRGPSVSVQTACSTSLVAIHMACQSLLNGECDAALAGGVSIRLPHGVGYVHQEGMVFSPDGRCRAFDASANGMLSGSGGGAVVLRRATDALAAGDPIRAIIRGTAVNNDGARKVGFTAPSVDGQAAVIAEALAIAGVEADTISYVEAHGTGTPLGDPIEVAALTLAFKDRGGPSHCRLGSVKTNVGHLDAAAGVAGFIKTVLALEQRQLPPTLHFTRPNPAIDFAAGGFEVQTSLSDWAAGDAPRRAGVSSFGIGGTNAHLVLQEAPIATPAVAHPGPRVLPLSARSADALAARAADLERYLGENPGVSLADVAWTLQTGRRAFEYRRAIVAAGVDEARAALAAAGGRIAHADENLRRSLVFMFPGQGSQYAGMARELSATQPVFREHFDRCLDLINARLGTNLRAILDPVSPADRDAAVLHQTRYAQPALFAVEYSLARLLETWLGRPAAVIGHSVGELVAACVAGVFSLEDAIVLAVERGRLMQSMPAGAMLAVAAAEADVRGWLDARIELAAVNAPAQSVLSGPSDAIAALEAQLSARGIVCHRLRTSHAFHSASMDAAASAFAQCVSRVPRHAPEIPIVSNADGALLSDEDAQSPQYWARQLRQTVRFADGISSLLEAENRLLLEVGPGSALSALVRRHPAFGHAHAVVATMRQAHEERSDEARLLEGLGDAWAQGAEVSWDQLADGETHRRISLPTYPFQRQRYWREADARDAAVAEPAGRADIDDWFYVPGWKRVAVTPATPADQPSAAEWLVAADEDALVTAVVAEMRARGHHVTTTGAAGGFFSLLDAVQAAGKDASDRGVRIVAISRGVFDVQGDEPLVPERALILGPLKVVPQEYAHVRCHHIDLRADAVDAGLAPLLVDALMDDTLPAAVAVRGRSVWRQTFERVTLPAIESGAVPPALRERGVYVVIGGLGSIGFTLARFLAERVHARLVLIGRSGVGSHAARVRELESLGADVLVFQADVADEDQMRAALDAARARFGDPDGVLHCAGERLTASIDDTTRALCQAQFRAKVLGLPVLERVLGDTRLDFCLIASSLSSVLGGLGLAAYTATHAFADAWVQQHNRHHATKWRAVNWDNWLAEDGSDEFVAGLAITTGHRHPEAVEAFERILGRAGYPQVLVSTSDLDARVGRWAALGAAAQADSTAPAAARYARPRLSTEYVSPETSLATTIATLWEELLQIDSVGIHDNFFELGGDSVISIRFLSKAARAGIRLTTRDVFERPTIAQLCEVATVTAASVAAAEQGVVTGEAPLTPIQRWFIEQRLPRPSFFNQALVYEIPAGIDVERLRAALAALLAHHDALRLAIVGREGAWRQRILPPPAGVPLTVEDLSSLPADRQEAAVAERVAALHHEIDLSSGVIVRCACLDCGPRPGRLAIVVHHAAIDGFSWRIVGADLEAAYRQVSDGARAIALPEKTTSMLAWANGLERLAADAPAAELGFWTRAAYRGAAALPRDARDGANTAGSVEAIELMLDADTTSALVQRVAKDHHARIDAIVQAALAEVLARVTGRSTVLFDSEGLGRDGLVSGADLSRTVGWCTSIHPVLLELPRTGESAAGAVIAAVRDQIAAIPEMGARYGVLRYMGGDAVRRSLEAMPRAEVVHCHFGEFEQPASGTFRPLHRQQLLAQRPEDVRPWLIEVDTLVYDGRLMTLWRFSGNVHRRETIEGWANGFLDVLRAFARDTTAAAAVNRTADYPQADLEQEELDELVAELAERFEDGDPV